MEEQGGDLLSIGFASFVLNSNNDAFLSSLFFHLDSTAIASHLKRLRCDVAFFYGCSLALSCYHNVFFSLPRYG